MEKSKVDYTRKWYLIAAIWGAFTLNYSDPAQIISATEASAAAQISGLRTTYIFIYSIIFSALLLSFWAVIKERQIKTSAQKA